MSANVRQFLKATLTPLVPAGWIIIDRQQVPETLQNVTVVMQHLEITPLPEAPIGSLKNRLVVTVADPHLDQERAENALDDAVLELCTALESEARIKWTGAEKVLVREQYLGWQVTVEINTQKE